MPSALEVWLPASDVSRPRMSAQPVPHSGIRVYRPRFSQLEVRISVPIRIASEAGWRGSFLVRSAELDPSRSVFSWLGVRSRGRLRLPKESRVMVGLVECGRWDSNPQWAKSPPDPKSAQVGPSLNQRLPNRCVHLAFSSGSVPSPPNCHQSEPMGWVAFGLQFTAANRAGDRRYRRLPMVTAAPCRGHRETW